MELTPFVEPMQFQDTNEVVYAPIHWAKPFMTSDQPATTVEKVSSGRRRMQSIFLVKSGKR